MNDQEVDIFGWIGGILIITVNIPQLVKLYRTKSGDDLSYYTLVLTIIGGIFFLVYGILLNKLPIIVSNVIIILIALIILFLKKKFKKNKNINKHKIQVTQI